MRVPVLSVVVPCYNEVEVLPETNKRLLTLLDRMLAAGLVADGSGVHYVDDGSRDGTWPLIERLAAAHGLVVQAIEAGPIREEQGRAVMGWYAWLRRVAA